MQLPEIKKRLEHIRRLSGDVHVEFLWPLFKSTASPSGWLCEIGTYYGYLAALMGHACIGTDRRVLVIDHVIGGMCDFPEGERCTYVDVIDNWIKAGIWDKMIPMPMKSLATLQMVTLLNPVIDLLWIDGDHNYEAVLNELRDFTAFVPVGGIVCGDDCNCSHPSDSFTKVWNGGDPAAFDQQCVSKAVWEYFRNNESYEVMPNVPRCFFAFRKVK